MKELVRHLACPKCKSTLHLGQTGDQLFCVTCELRYPIRDGIPILLIHPSVPPLSEGI
jgi:uncharacterized protein YbaR (Trm112 family)